MKHLTIGALCVFVIINLLLIIKNIFIEMNILAFILSCIALIIIFALVSFGTEKK